MKTYLSLAATAFVAIAVTSIVSAPARAEIEYPWCSISSTGQDGMSKCRYATIEQCNAFLGGQSGFCQPNPRAAAKAQVIRRSAR